MSVCVCLFVSLSASCDSLQHSGGRGREVMGGGRCAKLGKQKNTLICGEGLSPLLCRPAARLQITQTFLYPHMHFPFSSFLPDYFDGNMDFAQFLFFFLLSFTSKPKSVYFFSLNSSLFQLELLSSRSPPVFFPTGAVVFSFTSSPCPLKLLFALPRAG